MDNRINLALADDLTQQVLIAGVTDHERHVLGDGPVKARLQIIKYDYAFAGIGQFVDLLTADIASAARWTDATAKRLRRTYLYGPARCCKPDVSDGGIGLAHLYPAHQ